MDLEVVVLAAGEGKRMNSCKPKTLHEIAKKPMLLHVLETLMRLNPQRIHLVLGHKQDIVEEALKSFPQDICDKINICTQKEQLGTGHALMQAVPFLQADSKVLVVYGDIPLIALQDLNNLVQNCKDLCILTAKYDDPTGYGRILRDENNNIKAIVEQKDCNSAQLLIKEINTGIICTTSAIAKQYLSLLKNNNAQKEYYLTDLAALLAADHKQVSSCEAVDYKYTLGVNNKAQLQQLERIYQQDCANELLAQGVTLADAKRIDIRGKLHCGSDVFIDINCVFEGQVTLGNNVHIGPGCIIKDTIIADNSVISAYSIIEQSTLNKNNTIGPFARLRPGNNFADNVHVGNFVECKKASLGQGTKAGHLSYLGDATIGSEVNIGAGTITCNYDGANKHQTIIGNDVFVGSDSQIVAPCEIKNKVTIGAGTTMTSHIAHQEGDLIVTRAKARVIEKYKRPTKHKK